MKIKLAILEKDTGYLNRIVNVFGTKYADKIQLYSFTDPQTALETIESAKIDVLIASETIELDLNKLPKRVGFAYFVESQDIDMLNGQRAVCKFQKADLIYKSILSIYSENAGNVSGFKQGDENNKLIVFAPVSGGTGASTAAAACAMRFAARGKKTLYLNLEKFGASDNFFTAEGQFDMSDIVFALKSKKTNLAIKLESCVRQADNGVYFYSQTKIALDMLELSTDDINRLVTELQVMGLYDYIILDCDFSIDKNSLTILNKADNIVWVSDGSEISNTKLIRAYNALVTMEQNSESSIAGRIVTIYNKFSNKIGSKVEEPEIKNIGGAPRYQHATLHQVLEQLYNMDMFDKLM